MDTVVVLTTGGTIASVQNNETGLYASGAMPGEKLIDMERLQLQTPVSVESVFQVPSNAMDFDNLLQLYEKISLHALDPEVRGIVVTHGTDTLEESSYFMDLLYDKDKPVVFTGAQRTPNEEGTDAFTNIRDAIVTASCPDCCGLGVLVVFNEGVYDAQTVHKMHAFNVDAFTSPGYGHLGFVDKGNCWIRRRPSCRETYVPKDAMPRVEIVKASLGGSGREIQLLADDGAEGIVIEGLGRGHIPPAWMQSVRYARNKGIPMVITSTCGQGRVHPVYDFSGGVNDLASCGVIMGHDYAPLKARIKLILLLASGLNSQEALSKAFSI